MNNISGYHKKDCCGCSACANICPKECIHMKYDDEGFGYPHIEEEKCINCGLCKNICPIIKRDETNSKKVQKTKVYATNNKDKDILYSSSSGGMFKEISNFIIENDGIVFGVKYNSKFQVVYSYSITTEECDKFKGSKYVQSDIGNSFKKVKEFLDLGKIVLFVGTPCYVEGLKLFLKKDYENLYTCDIICHGTPSPKLFSDYVKFLENKNKSKIKSINMKYKEIGWENPIIKVEFDNYKTIKNTKEVSLWTDIFFNHFATRPSCHDCRFTNFNRPSDITIGDYWGIRDVHPDFYEHNGVSLVLVNSKKGDYIFENIKDNINYIKSDTEKCLQPNLYKPASPSSKREVFWNDYLNNSFQYVAKNYLNYNIFTILKSRIKTILKRK